MDLIMEILDVLDCFVENGCSVSLKVQFHNINILENICITFYYNDEFQSYLSERRNQLLERGDSVPEFLFSNLLKRES